MITEWCSNCDIEVDIPKDTPSTCPNCNRTILPCSACEYILQGLTSACKPKNGNVGCDKFPGVEQGVI